MPLLESGEMYLETILVLKKSGKTVRSIDICEHMGYSKPSVSRAVGNLKSGGFITVDKNGFIELTDQGRDVANKILDRHTLLTDFLVKLGVSPYTASNDACRIEHHISDESFEAIKRYAQQKGMY